MAKADNMLYKLVIRINGGVPGEFRICSGKTKELLLFNIIRGVKETLGEDIPKEKDWKKDIRAEGSRRVNVDEDSKIYILECK